MDGDLLTVRTRISRRRLYLALSLVLFSFPCSVALIDPLRVLGGRNAAGAGLACGWLAFAAGALLYMSTRCPKCVSYLFARSGFGNPLAKRCMHCNKLIWTDREPDPRRTIRATLVRITIAVLPARVLMSAIPELSRVTSSPSRRAILHNAIVSSLAPWGITALVAVQVTCGVMLGTLMLVMCSIGLTRAQMWLAAGITVMFLFLPLVAARLCIAACRKAVRTTMSAQGFAICTTCGYDLTGNSDGKCPECGQKVHDACM